MTPEGREAPREVPLLQGVLGWAVLALVLFSALALGANRPVSWTLMALLVMPLFAAQILCDLARGLPLPARRAAVPALLYLAVLAWAVLQTLPAPDPDWAHPAWARVPDVPGRISAAPMMGPHHVLRLAAYGMVFWIVLRAACCERRALGFLRAIALWSTGLAVFGLAAVASGVNPILGAEASQVVSASFVNRNSYATYAVFGVVANLALVLRLQAAGGQRQDAPRRQLRRVLERFLGGGWIFAAGLLICLAALLATQSRAGGLAGLVAILSYLAVARRRGEGLRGPVWLAVAAILGFAAIMLSGGVLARLIASGAESPRFAIYPRILEAILDRPLLGSGLGAFRNVFRPYVPPEAAQADWELAHNSYLENALELGLPATAAFYLSLLILAGFVFRGALIRRRNRIFPCFALACIAGAAFHAAFDFSLQMPAVAALFAAILGIGCAHAWSGDRRLTRRPDRERPRMATPGI